MKQLNDIVEGYIDNWHQIVQADGDGGDSLNRIGCFESACAVLPLEPGDRLMSNQMLHWAHLGIEQGIEPGRYRRHPDQDKWSSNINNVTRDQMQPLEAAWALTGNVAHARRHMALRLKRGMLHFSHENDGLDAGPLKTKMPDLPTGVELGIIIRAVQFKFLFPLLYFFDLFLLLDVLFFRRTDRNIWDMDNQLLPAVLASVKVQPTFISLLAAKEYARTDAAARLTNYYSLVHNGIPPLGQLMVAAFETLKG